MDKTLNVVAIATMLLGVIVFVSFAGYGIYSKVQEISTRKECAQEFKKMATQTRDLPSANTTFRFCLVQHGVAPENITGQ